MTKKNQKTTKAKKNAQKVLSVKGVININRSGLGFVSVEGLERDIIVYPENLNTAIEGDTVKIDILIQRHHGSKKSEGVVKEILQRKQSEFIGILEVKENYGFLLTDKRKVSFDIYIPVENLMQAKDGDRALVSVCEWRKKKNPLGKVIKIFPPQSENEEAMQEILLENNFPLYFTEEVIKEAEQLEHQKNINLNENREDFRSVLTFTIDPEDAKDFDDALSIRKLDAHYYEVAVHIADVSHFIKPGTPLDQEAALRATSVYLPDRVLPMLPEQLSNHLCSLRPQEDKFCAAAIFEISLNGKIRTHRFAKTLICSDRRFTYEEAQDRIEGKEGDYANEILLLNTISKKLRKDRFEQGAINFSSTELRFKLDENAVPIGIIVKESKEAHQLIEEWMLLANKYVASYISALQKNNEQLLFPYRVHDLPNEEKLANYASFVSRFGYKLSLNNPKTIAASFNKMLQEAHGKPEQHIIESLGIRTMSKASYTTTNIGHYGLGFEHYCHFTSPIRRYPDILVHRILFNVLNHQNAIIKDLEEQCKHCSTQEKNAMEAERSAHKYKQVEFMKPLVGNTFDAIISGVSHFGIFVETIEHKCEGLISVNSLLDIDQFQYSESELLLKGKHKGLKFSYGQKLKVCLIKADLEKKQLDFELAEINSTIQKKNSKTKNKTKK